MSDPGCAAFKVICPRVFRIETQWWKKGGGGTGFSIGRMLQSNRLALATAGHVIDFPPNEPVKWLVQQFDKNGTVERQVRFTTRESDGESLYTRHKEIDIGFVVIPPEDDDGKPFTRPDEAPLPVIAENKRICEGTRVGWAGFAGQVEDYLGHPQVCYFEGVISAFRGGTKPVYVVDGHNAPGVSGGPVWHWPEGGDRIEVVGVVSGYGPGEAAFPGFCVFTPINPLIAFIRASYRTAEIKT